MTRRKPPLPKRPPPDATPRRVRHIKATKENIALLRPDAYALLDFPELLDEPKWRRAALVIVEMFIAQNPYPPLRPRGIAALVDESIEYKLKQGVPLAEAIETARGVYAEMLRKRHETIKRAHLRYGKRGVTKAP